MAPPSSLDFYAPHLKEAVEQQRARGPPSLPPLPTEYADRSRRPPPIQLPSPPLPALPLPNRPSPGPNPYLRPHSQTSTNLSSSHSDLLDFQTGNNWDDNLLPRDARRGSDYDRRGSTSRESWNSGASGGGSPGAIIDYYGLPSPTTNEFVQQAMPASPTPAARTQPQPYEGRRGPYLASASTSRPSFPPVHQSAPTIYAPSSTSTTRNQYYSSTASIFASLNGRPSGLPSNPRPLQPPPPAVDVVSEGFYRPAPIAYSSPAPISGRFDEEYQTLAERRLRERTRPSTPATVDSPVPSPRPDLSQDRAYSSPGALSSGREQFDEYEESAASQFASSTITPATISPRRDSVDTAESTYVPSAQRSLSTSSQPTFASQKSYSSTSPFLASSTLSPHGSIRTVPVHRGDSGPSRQSSIGNGLPEFLNPALLSNIAVFVKQYVKSGMNRKGAVEYSESFTGQDLVTCVQLALPPSFLVDRRYALHIARALQRELFFHEVDYDIQPLKDSIDRVYQFPDEAEYRTLDEVEELPTGVLTALTHCYSSLCGFLTSEGLLYECYSSSCPSRVKNDLHRQPSLFSTSSYSSEIVEEAENWETSVPKTVVESLSKEEIARQSLIFELIQGEQNYYNDLSFIETGFVQPLRNSSPPIIPLDQLDNSLSLVLSNIEEIRTASKAFLEALLARQREQYPIIQSIGDIVLEAASRWGVAYHQYTTNLPFAEIRFKKEKISNPRFLEFLAEFSRKPESNRQSFEHFQTRSTFRAVRYSLLLEPILKHTPVEDPDHPYVKQALEVIREQSAEADKAVALSKSQIACKDYHRDLVRKPGDTFDLELLDLNRRHYFAGKVFRRPDGTGFTEWVQAYLILFDHYLVITKPRRLGKYLISRRAVPLELLSLTKTSFTDPPVPRSTGFHLRAALGSSSHPAAASASLAAGDATLVYPITFRQIGRYGGTVSYYVDSANARKIWEKKLTEAIAARNETVQKNPVVRLEPLSDRTFGAESFGSLEPKAPPATLFGRPSSSMPLRTHDGQDLICVGSPAGLFIGKRGNPRSLRQVLHLQEITQCAVLQEYGFILVVAARQLIAYNIEALIPSGRPSDPSTKIPQKLSGQKDVLFFRVGRIGEASKPKTLVVYAKKSGLKESVFNVLEPVSSSEKNRSGGGSRFLGFGAKTQESFRTYKDFFIPSSSYSIQFLRSKLAIICTRGIEIMDLENLRTMSVPDFSNQRGDPNAVSLARRCEDSKMLGMFRLAVENEFLLCYNDFAFLVDKHGEPLPGGRAIIDWESKPEQVAFHQNHVYAFSPSMIEIRHASTGRLAQIILGSQISLTYDGSGIDKAPISNSNSYGGEEEGLEKRLHFTMRAAGYHTVYEIVPL